MKLKNKMINTKDMIYEDWLEQRKKGIGGSDASTIVGLNKYSSLFSLYCDKKGILPAVEDNEAMKQGRELEDYVARRFIEETGKKVRNKNAIILHNEFDYIYANIDRDIIGENAGLECKTTTSLNLKAFKNGEFPANYYVQCMHYMAVTGAEKWYLAVLIFGTEFKVFEIKRDEEEINALITAEKDFWNNHILADIPPATDGSKATKNALNFMYDDVSDNEIELDLDAELKRLETFKFAKKEIEKSILEIENIIKFKIGSNSRVVSTNHIVTYKTQFKNTVDKKRLFAENSNLNEKDYNKISVSRPLRIKEKKESK